MKCRVSLSRVDRVARRREEKVSFSLVVELKVGIQTARSRRLIFISRVRPRGTHGKVNLVSQDGSEGFLRPSIPVNGGIRFHPDHSMDETFLNDSTDHMKSR